MFHSFQAKSAGHSRGSSISRPASEYNLETGSSVDEGLGSVSAVSGNDGVSLPSEATFSSEPPAPASASSVELENKLLRSELLSLNQEVSSLLKRNHKSEEESKRLRGKVSIMNFFISSSLTLSWQRISILGWKNLYHLYNIQFIHLEKDISKISRFLLAPFFRFDRLKVYLSYSNS